MYMCLWMISDVKVYQYMLLVNGCELWRLYYIIVLQVGCQYFRGDAAEFFGSKVKDLLESWGVTLLLVSERRL